MTNNNENVSTHPMWIHVNASLEEKVKILSENPYRYYIGLNVWTFRSERLVYLEEYLKQAESEEKYELCSTILEVKKFLKAIHDHDNKSERIFLLKTEDTVFDIEVCHYLIKEGGLFKLYYNYNKEDFKEMTYSKDSIVINESLSINDILKLIKNMIERNLPLNGIARFSKPGLIDEIDFNKIIQKIKDEVNKT